MKIAILTPTRGRPERFAEMVESVRETSTGVAIFAGLDDDDEGSYPRIKGVRYLVKPRMQLGAWTNDLASRTWDDFDVLASFGDDHRCRTPGWDEMIRVAFAQMSHAQRRSHLDPNAVGSGLVYTRDGLQDQRLPTAPLWSADVIRSLGWYFPPNLVHLYADDFWLRLGHDTFSTYLPDVLIEHMHPAAGKASTDESYRESNSAEMDRRDHRAFDEYMAGAYATDLERVRRECGFS